jgi:predicted enzyme related to lactoylglutathione lyase
MPLMTKYEAGTPSWVDLGTPDPQAASRFYSDLFGWTITEGPPEAGGYRMCLLDDKPVAGLGPQMNPDAPPSWSTYISVGDADVTAAAIKEDGGDLLVAPMDVLDVGRMAVATDPTGAVFSIWQPRSHTGAAIVNEPNTFCWSELTTRAPQKSVEFYGAVFGWTATLLPMDGQPDYTEFRVNDRGIAGMLQMTDSWPEHIPNHWMVYFAVDDCDSAVSKAEAFGAAVLMTPTDVPPGRFATIRDPQGAVFSMIALREQGPDAEGRPKSAHELDPELDPDQHPTFEAD